MSLKIMNLILIMIKLKHLENNEFNLYNDKTEGVFQYKGQGFQIKLLLFFLLFPLTKCKRVVNF